MSITPSQTSGIDINTPPYESAHDQLGEVISPRRLNAELTDAGESITKLKAVLNWGREQIALNFESGVAASTLVAASTELVDRVLIHAWAMKVGSNHGLCLCAAGGYGRRELLPESDVDLLILHPGKKPGDATVGIEQFLMLLWDLGLDVGHSVRSVGECVRQADDDITVMTNLMESRVLAGDAALHHEVMERTGPDHIWPVADFYRAKLEEQIARHAKFDDTGYKLEPNIKESPGGLRDIHTILWIAKRLYPGSTLADLTRHGLLTAQESAELVAGQDFLWRVRFALHMQHKRHEDRLLFDSQLRIAEQFGYTDSEHNRGVEQFMQAYYRRIKALSCMNDLMLALFDDEIHPPSADDVPQSINRRFHIRGSMLEASSNTVFKRHPHALLEVFLLLQQHPEASAIAPSTLRLIRRDIVLMDDRVRNDIRAKSLFMEILRQPEGVTRALRRMNRYGVLGAYIPAFGQITGRMQYDLFHTLTVDEHTLFLVRNQRRLALERFRDEHPYFSGIMDRIPKHEVLYLAGLFHDIAKGRGGDHSELGAEDAIAFCHSHGLPGRDGELIAWLVRQHLLMSMTAQRKDLSDPAVIHEFAEQVETRERLDYLTLLTMCDIRATNPKLWNSWRESLLKQLYGATCRQLDHGTSEPVSEEQLVAEAQHATRAVLALPEFDHRVDDASLARLWMRCSPDYFLRFEPEELAWHARKITEHAAASRSDPLVRLKFDLDRGATLFIHMEDRDYLFATVTAVLDRLSLTILEARLESTSDGYTMDSYGVAESDGSTPTDPVRVEEIRATLQAALETPDAAPTKVSQRMSRRAKAFATPTQIYFEQDEERGRTVMELIATDRPGLLSIVGRVFERRGILLAAAKIGTIGERAEDVFFMTDTQGQPLTDPNLLAELRSVLTRVLQRVDQKPDAALDLENLERGLDDDS